MGLILGLIGVCEIAGRLRRGDLHWRRTVTDAAVVAVATGAVCVAFYVHSESTIAAVTGTVYPGRRRDTGGHTSLFQLLSAPFGVALADHGTTLEGTNQSEISSFLLLGPFALLQMFRIRLRDLGQRWRMLLLGAAAGLVLVSAWYLVSLPPLVARLLLLDRSPPYRAIIGVGVGGFLLMALFCAAEVEPAVGTGEPAGRVPRLQREFARRVASGAAVCGVLAFGLYFWAGRQFIDAFRGLGLNLWSVGLFSGLAAVVVWLTSGRRVLLGGVALIAFGAVVSLVANPLYLGLGPLTSSPLLPTLHTVAEHPADPANTTWLSYAAPPVNDVLLASGLQTVNAVDFYPEADVWKILDPHHRHSYAWNRYANLSFAPGAPGSDPVITLIQDDSVRVTLDPCGTAATQLHIGYVLSPAPVAGSCLHLEARPMVGHVPLYVYTRSAPGS